ncbi:MAG: fimbria/pilus outer membrane usher protein [Pantoea sp.]|nr:fimbria/pilus outer membrane usher protein [Pantoea sp.]
MPHGHGWQRLLLLAAMACAEASGTIPERANSDEIVFDSGLLSGRGVDPQIAELFRHAPRFMPGITAVQLTVNGEARGMVQVKFDDRGTLCADRAFMQQAGLHIPSDYDEDIACFDLRRAWPRAAVHPEPGEGKIRLLVPTDALSPAAQTDSWQHGGVAGMLNYEAQYQRSAGNGNSASYIRLGTEAGFNAGDWILRSRQFYAGFSGKKNITHEAIYAQRTFTRQQKVIQIGQIGLGGSLLGGGQVLGLHVFPESALLAEPAGAGRVEGVAESESVVEVRQSGMLIYSTTLPAGPFLLSGLPLLNTRSDLEVTLTDSSAQRREFTAPAAVLQAYAPLAVSGLRFGAGRLTQQSGSSPLVGLLENGWLPTPHTSVTAGLSGTRLYHAGALKTDTQLFRLIPFSLQAIAAWDSAHGHRGMLLSAALRRQLNPQLSINLSGRRQTSGYRELGEALQPEDRSKASEQARNHYQWGTGISWLANPAGVFSLSWAQSTAFNGKRSNYLRGGWSYQYAQANLSLSVEQSSAQGDKKETRLYLLLTLPLRGQHSLSTTLSASGQHIRSGLRYSGRSRQGESWSLASDWDQQSKVTSVSGSFNTLTRTSQLSATLSRNSQHYTSWSAAASGAVVIHRDGLTLSPYALSDTFAIGRVGEERGVRLDTPSGPVWTDGRGFAVLPGLGGYRRVGIQIDTRTLGKKTDIGNAWQELELARGAVGRLDFAVVRTRRVLIEAQRPDGAALPYGASVFAEDGTLVTVVGEAGATFIPNAAPDMKLEVQTSGKKLCVMTLALPQESDASLLYETATATCR